MNRKIIVTGDNSKTLLIPDLDETYHSTHGALNEAIHVFIEAGLKHFPAHDTLRVFEMGFGTGLNALVSLNYALNSSVTLEYTTLEKHPLNWKEVEALNYTEHFDAPELPAFFKEIHEAKWNEFATIHPQFSICKLNNDLAETNLSLNHYDVIFYDAFGPRVQPDLWTTDHFKKMYNALSPNGILVTYCAQGQFKRNLKAAGFEVESLPGPPGKREMTRGLKK